MDLSKREDIIDSAIANARAQLGDTTTYIDGDGVEQPITDELLRSLAVKALRDVKVVVTVGV